jgi:predicted TIM-barrel fold metal-dependent hydrolase
MKRRTFLAGAAFAGTGLLISRALPSAHVEPSGGRLIVDSQIHIWLPDTPDRPWLPNRVPQMPDAFTIGRLIPIIDEAGVDRIVLVPPSWEGARNDYVEKAVEDYPGRFGVVGLVSTDNREHALETLANWRSKTGFLGVRQGPGRNGESLEWFWTAAEKAAIPICFLASGRNAEMGKVAESHPGLTLIVDHMGISEEFMKSNPAWPDEINKVVAGLAKYPNVSVKLSSIPLFSTQPYPWRDTISYIHRLYDAYGPLRCHWGSDLTHTFAKATYRQRVTQFTEELPFLSEADKDWIMGRSLLARLRWA